MYCVNADIDIAVVNSFLLFKEHQAEHPDNKAPCRPVCYSLGDFREKIVRQLCNFPEYGEPPVSTSVKPTPPAPPPCAFETVHIPSFSQIQTCCVVCYKQGRGELKLRSFCHTPQCQGKYMHVTTRECFTEFHTREYHS